MTKRLGSEQWDERCGGSELLWTARPNRFLVSELEAHAAHDRALVGWIESISAIFLDWA
jgi:hypothetical protein